MLAIALGLPLVFAFVASDTRAAPTTTVFELAVATATVGDGGAAVSSAWLTAQIDEANRLFSPLGVRFVGRTAPSLPPELSRIETREDRDRLGLRMAPRAINVFVVASLRDVDEAERYRKG